MKVRHRTPKPKIETPHQQRLPRSAGANKSESTTKQHRKSQEPGEDSAPKFTPDLHTKAQDQDSPPTNTRRDRREHPRSRPQPHKRRKTQKSVTNSAPNLAETLHRSPRSRLPVQRSPKIETPSPKLADIGWSNPDLDRNQATPEKQQKSETCEDPAPNSVQKLRTEIRALHWS